MNLRNLFLSLFLVFTVSFALVQAEDTKPRGPKITSKVNQLHIDEDIETLYIVLMSSARSILTSSMTIRTLVGL